VGAVRGLKIKPFSKPAPARTIGAVWRKSTTRGPAIEAVVNAIRTTMNEGSRR
jgi:DNA-binding transcriptional LysR family regulator